jgi:hypothetical protein
MKMLQGELRGLIDIPDVVLLKILSCLSAEDLAMSIPYIDERRNKISKSAMLWKNITFTPAYNMTKNGIVIHLKHMPEPRSFRLRHGIHIDMIVNN